MERDAGHRAQEPDQVLWVDAGHTGRLAQDRRGRVRGSGGAVGVGEIHPPADDRRPRGDHGRHVQHRREGSQPSPAQAARRRHGVPELRPLSPHDGVRQPGVRAEGPGPRARRDSGARQDGRRHRRDGRIPPTQARATIGRTAPARGHGPGHGAQHRPVPAGRAAVQSGRQAPDPDARGDTQAARPPGRHLRLRDPRPDRGHDPRR